MKLHNIGREWKNVYSALGKWKWWGGRRLKYSEGNFVHWHLAQHKAHMWTGLGLSLGLYGERPVCNCLSHGMVSIPVVHFTHNLCALKATNSKWQFWYKHASTSVQWLRNINLIAWVYIGNVKNIIHDHHIFRLRPHQYVVSLRMAALSHTKPASAVTSHAQGR